MKNEDDLVYAYENGVRYTTADSIEELEKIKEFAPEMKVIWRVKTYEEKKLKYSLSDKFGDAMCTESDECAHKRFK